MKMWGKKEVLDDLYRGYFCIACLAAWAQVGRTPKVRVQSSVFVWSRLKMALGCSSRPNPFFPWLQRGARSRAGAGSELGGQLSFALLHCVLIGRLTQALPHVGYQATKLQQESWHHLSAEQMPSQQGRDAEPGCAWKGPRARTCHLQSRIHAPTPPLTFRLESCSLAMLSTSRFPAFQGRFGRACLCLILFQMP